MFCWRVAFLSKVGLATSLFPLEFSTVAETLCINRISPAQQLQQVGNMEISLGIIAFTQKRKLIWHVFYEHVDDFKLSN